MPEKTRIVCVGCNSKLGEQEPGEMYRGGLIHRLNVCRVKRERKFFLYAKFALMEIVRSGRHLFNEAVLLLKITEADSLTQLVEDVAKVMLNRLAQAATATVGNLIERLDGWWMSFVSDQAPISQTVARHRQPAVVAQA